MSAYVCNPEHFGILAAYAVRNNCEIPEWRVRKDAISAQNIAKGLARKNIRSVATRYPNDTSGNRPGPCLGDEEIEEAAAIYAAYFVVTPQPVTALQIIKLCEAIDYQSCETEDWKDTLAWRQLDWIRRAAISSLKGYDEAKWSFDQPLPAIEALYVK